MFQRSLFQFLVSVLCVWLTGCDQLTSLLPVRLSAPAASFVSKSFNLWNMKSRKVRAHREYLKASVGGARETRDRHGEEFHLQWRTTDSRDRQEERQTGGETDRCYMTVGPSVAQPVCLTELGELSLFEPGKVPGSVLISCCQDGFIMFAVLIFSQFFVSLRWFYFHFSASVLLIPLDVRFGSVTEVQSEYQISLSNVRTWMKLWANVVWRESFCTAGENMRSD